MKGPSIRWRFVLAEHDLIVTSWYVEGGALWIHLDLCASPLVAMKAPSSGPNGWRLPPINSAKTSAACRGSCAGIDTWWIITPLPCRFGIRERRPVASAGHSPDHVSPRPCLTGWWRHEDQIGVNKSHELRDQNCNAQDSGYWAAVAGWHPPRQHLR